MEIDYIEFDDPDDPRSSRHPDNDSIRFTIAPEGMVIALPNGGTLHPEDQQALGQMLRMAYQQGKRVGKLTSKNTDTPSEDSTDE